MSAENSAPHWFETILITYMMFLIHMMYENILFDVYDVLF